MGFLDMKAARTAEGLSVAPAKPCDSCKSSTALIFCRVDSAFLCLSCDSKLHSFTKLTSQPHARVWMCYVCEQAPAAVTCKADAAALCVSCDFDIHSANPLARRHERIPVEPFYDSAAAESVFLKSSALNFFGGNVIKELGGQSADSDATNWNMNSPMLLESAVVKNGDFFLPEIENFLDFEFPSYQQQQQQQGAADSVVPLPVPPPTKPVAAPTLINHSSETCFEIDFGKPKISPFNFFNHSITQSVSSSEVGVVPDGNSMSEISCPSGRNVNTVPDSSVSGDTNTTMTNQACGLDREARVLRYREKRKNRKFEKTIRYASRKAYAETRPRIKGRFAKRTEVGSEIDQIYGSMSPVAFGVVPTF